VATIAIADEQFSVFFSFGFKIVKMANKKTRGPDKAKTNTDNIVVKRQEDAPDIVKQPPVFTDDSRYSYFFKQSKCLGIILFVLLFA
jgi:hypothetical protein